MRAGYPRIHRGAGVHALPVVLASTRTMARGGARDSDQGYALPLQEADLGSKLLPR